MTGLRDSMNPDGAAGAMLAEHYDEVRRIARAILNGDSAAQRMQPTELANEAALRLIQLHRLDPKGRTHYLSISARVMRQVLVDEARKFRAAKRQAPPVMTQWQADGYAATTDIEALDRALIKLEGIDPDKAKLVEQRIFAGLTVEEIAELSGMSESTVKRQWRVARAWLIDELTAD